MPNGTKIATCNYCGTRAALVLRGTERHELSCAACGAPLHDLKALKASAKPKRDRDYGISHKAPPKPRHPPRKDSRRRKKRRGLKWFLEEAFDVIEDILD